MSPEPSTNKVLGSGTALTAAGGPSTTILAMAKSSPHDWGAGLLRMSCAILLVPEFQVSEKICQPS